MAVRSVLGEFFIQTADGWRNSKADSVIGEAQAKSLKAKESATVRWGKDGCERNANASKVECERNASHKPLATSHKEQKTAPEGEADLFAGVDPQVVRDFKALRTKLRAAITATAVAGIRREADKAGMTLEAALVMCCERGWRGFKSEWITADTQRGNVREPTALPRLQS